MSMKQEIETWVAALQHYDSNEFDEAIRTFQHIADTSKIFFNCGVIRATLGEHEAAIDYYAQATGLDQYFSIAYFQSGVSHFLLGEFEQALVKFNDALLYLRGNAYIDYEQLGLKYKLYSCEVLFNRGLSYIYLQQNDLGMRDLVAAADEKKVPEHDVIDEAIREKAEGYTVFSIPVGVIFRPSDAKVKNVRTRDYLGKPTLVAAARAQNQTHHPQNLSAESWARDDRPADQISYGATNLVRQGLSSRTRQQSEPPMQRTLFPPTPPPEIEKLSSTRPPSGRSQTEMRRAASPPRARSRSATRRPERLELGAAAFERPPPKETSRRGAPRSVSERPSERRRLEQDERPGQVPDSTLRSRSTRERLFGALDNDLPDLDARSSRDHATNRGNLYPRQSGHQARPDNIEEEIEETEMYRGEDGDQVRASVSTFASGYGYRRAGSRAPTLRRLRAKVHLREDTRYIIISTETSFEEFAQQVVRKFALRTGVENIKLKVKDEEGDMITVGDQEDFDVQAELAKEEAKREGADIGKFEFWVVLNTE